MFAIDIVITYITVRNQMISTIHFNTAGYLHDGAQARVNVRGAGGKGEEQKKAFHWPGPISSPMSPRKSTSGRIDWGLKTTR